MGKTNLIVKSMLCMTLILFPQMFNPQVVKLYCIFFDDNEAVIKVIMKGRSPTMRHVSRTHRVALDWLFDRINLDPKIQIKYIDTKNQLADILTKGNFTRDEWNHLLTLFNISHFSSTSCIASDGETSSTRIRRRTCHSQITTYDEFDRKDAFVRVNLQLHQTRGGPRMDIKILKDLFLTIERGNPFEMSRSDCSQKDYGLSWSSQVWKSGDGEHDRSGQPDKNSWDSLGKVDPHRGEHLLGRTAHSARNEETIHDRTGKPASENIQGKADFENFIMGSETTEFVNKVRNQVRIRQKRMSSNAENCTEHSIIWENVYGYNIECSDIYGKELFNDAKCCAE